MFIIPFLLQKEGKHYTIEMGAGEGAVADLLSNVGGLKGGWERGNVKDGELDGEEEVKTQGKQQCLCITKSHLS